MTDPSFAHGLVGATLDGRYRLDAVLGEGGMGAVFRATHLALDRKVAVKLLKPHLTSDEAALQRFAREARATRKVESPHAVKILDFGVTPSRDYYMVLEYLDGRTVQRELEIDGRFAPARVAHIARQALAALATAHRHGLVHRDIKPDNLLLMRVGADPDYTKVLDFGVAKLMQGAAGDQLALTAAGVVFGTPEYMSPEQACGYALDGRSDLYSLAVTMFVMLTGRPLFEGGTAIEWLTHHARTVPPRLAAVKPELAGYPALDDLIQRCLAKDRELRPASAAEMSAQLAVLEPLLAGAGIATGPAAVLAPTPETPTRVSSYVEALRDRLPALVPSAAAAPVARRSRRWIYVGLGAGLVSVTAAAALVVRGSDETTAAVRAAAPRASSAVAQPAAIAAAPPPNAAATAPPGSPPPGAVMGLPGPPPPNAATAPPALPSPTGATRGDAGTAIATNPLSPAAAGAASAFTPADPRPAQPVRTRPRPAPARTPVRAPNPEAEQHLQSAEDAFRANNRLRQLAEADLALRADPLSVRARFLLADALLKGGDLDRGCAHLRDIKGSSIARDRARTAGCPGD